MASRRTVITHDKMRNSHARKDRIKALKATQQQQAEVLQKLISQAKTGKA
jgi:hypothetical protein